LLVNNIPLSRIGAIVNGAAVFEYKITGAWDDPIIEKL
jgi:uncharacterized protein YhdP